MLNFQQTTAIIVALLSLCVVSPSQAVQPVESTADVRSIDLTSFFLRPPSSGTIEYRGIVDRDKGAGQAGAMLYPAYGLAGFVAAIATHGAMSEVSKSSERQRLQASADEVLRPYQDDIAGFQAKELMQSALINLGGTGDRRLVEGTEGSEKGWVIDSAPQFSLSNDQSALVLDNMVQVYRAESPAHIRYRNLIRVISEIREVGEDSKANWLLLKEDSMRLMTHSLQLLVSELGIDRSGMPEINKTFRYHEGKTFRTERGLFLGEVCGRVHIKTLRGWLMSVPTGPETIANPKEGANKC
ncbi:hypothetical protein [Acidovorax sp. 106]|uniref:hypothetical protein n=1 Tax=Acidovorax sp. 106 TaxID=2135637 RepID=UPI0011C3A7E4|nr:hypothetical protein [Acidovorax sp. 106]